MPSMSELLEKMRAKKNGLPASKLVIEDSKHILNGNSAEGAGVVKSQVGHSNLILDLSNKDEDKYSEEYLQGFNASRHGMVWNDNPYDLATQEDEADQWDRGFEDHQNTLRNNDRDKNDGVETQGQANFHQLPSSEPVTVDIIDEDQLLEQATEIILNTKQMEAHTLALSGKSMCLIGAAGTGKTTSMKKITRDIIDNGHIPLLVESTKHLRIGHPGIVVVSFTNKAVNNIRKNVDQRIKVHTITAHKLLEFHPVRYEIEDEKNGGTRTTMKFEAFRDEVNPLPVGLRLIIWEESSMIGTPLYNRVKAAMPHNHQEIFLGDIQQLPPVFGSAVLGFKMNELPVVELTEVYRQALESPIIKLAWKILEGNPHDFSAHVVRSKLPNGKTWLNCPSLDAMNYNDPIHGSLEFRIWQKVTTETQALMATQMMFKNWYNEGKYNPYKDVILCPYNMKYGTIEINKLLAQYFSIQRGEAVHEIVAGYEKVYYAVGDRVLVGKEDAFIESIEPNPAYLGKTSYTVPSIYLDRWGIQQTPTTSEEVLQHKIDQGEKDEAQTDYFLEGDGSIDDIDGDSRVNAASHIITCRFSYSDEIVVLKSASELKPPAFLGGYCITVHKFQGSEEEKVFILLHQIHSKMVRRELLYTAVTRARKHLVIVCENSSFEKGVAKQSIKGDTIAEKAEVFKGKLEEIKNDDDVPVLSQDLVMVETTISSENVSEVQLSGHQPQEQIEDTSDIASEMEQSAQSETIPVEVKLTPMQQKLADMKARMKK